jgi:hypothetical protein
MDLGRLGDLVEKVAERHAGVTVRPVERGELLGGIGSSQYYEFDGWEIGLIWHWGGDELAVGATISEAVEAALSVIEAAA